MAKSIGVYAHPSLVIFRQYGKEPIIYAGDIKNKDAMLEWLLVQKDPTNEAIEEQVKIIKVFVKTPPTLPGGLIPALAKAVWLVLIWLLSTLSSSRLSRP